MQATDYKSTQLQGITDLTVLCPIRPKFIEGAFETELHVERLRRVLAVLNGIRIFSREASPGPSPFADSVGRFQSIHFFRFAVVDPAPAEALTGGHQLLLNVTFDGGWEPYMRLIWKPLGSMLDLIFCHNESYPQSWESSFEKYSRWVRANEVRGRFFYADSAASVADAQHGKQIEALQRRLGGAADADCRAAGLALPPPMGPAAPTPEAVRSALRVLKAVYSLIKLFPGNTERDGALLLRFARELLVDLRRWVADGEFDPGARYGALRIEPEISWLMQPLHAGRAAPDRLHLDPAAVQAGILSSFKRPPTATVHGALVLLRVEDAALALAWLANGPISSEASASSQSGDDPVISVALTFPGLVALGLPASQRQKFPREFIDGMEARAGILGDVRGNHPVAWTRPPRNWVHGAQAAPIGAPVDLTSVHLLVQLRTLQRAGENGVGQQVLPRLQAAILKLGCGAGLAVMAVQAGHSLPLQHGELQPRNKFGFVDGVSQPVIGAAVPAPQTWRDEVRPGELFLGYANDRGDGPPAVDSLLDNGSFLVVRKLRIYPERLDSCVADAVRPGLSADTVRAKLMGRRPDGRNLLGLAGNDFDYRGDATGSSCPLASHARRCNPREPRADGVMPPRLMRRGLSYGHGNDDEDGVGLLFMAYNASIAEQFEILQRWIAGGNSTGVSAAQDDPFLGVPEPGTPRIFRFEHAGAVQRVDLGPEPLVSLQWGLYAFVPSMAALKALPALCVPEAKLATVKLLRPGSFDRWKAVLEDSVSREAAWAQVRLAGGVLHTPYGLLVGGKTQVQTVLQDDGGRFSTGGYGDRMAASIGRGFLGQDNVCPHGGHERPSVERVNQAIEALTQAQAYDATLSAMADVLPALMGHQKAAPVDLERLANLLLARLCTAWFGAPDGSFIKNGARVDDPAAPPLCPGHLVGMSRYVFAPDPSGTVAGIAAPQGQSFTAAIRKLLPTSGMKKAPLTQAILAAHGPASEQAQAELIAGIMLGFPATVLGNLLTLLKFNAETRELWDWQARLYSQVAPPWPAAPVIALLHGPLMTAMRRATVPYMVWRTAMADGSLGGVTYKAGDKVVVGLGSALADGGDAMLIFGGKRHDTVHACSGYPMAVGVLVGFFTALLTAGELGSTADPRVFNIKLN